MHTHVEQGSQNVSETKDDQWHVSIVDICLKQKSFRYYCGNLQGMQAGYFLSQILLLLSRQWGRMFVTMSSCDVGVLNFDKHRSTGSWRRNNAQKRLMAARFSPLVVVALVSCQFVRLLFLIWGRWFQANKFFLDNYSSIEIENHKRI